VYNQSKRQQWKKFQMTRALLREKKIRKVLTEEKLDDFGT
jgi:hypothetical protein